MRHLCAGALALLVCGWLSAARAAPAAGEVFRDCPTCVDMLVVPAGSNAMGSLPDERAWANTPKSFGDREDPRHTVAIRAFALGKTEVTKALYARFVAETGYDGKHGCASFDKVHDGWPVMPERTWREPGFKQGDDEPAVCINWNDASAFVSWYAKLTGKAYRLPSEAEWEYAARAGSHTTYPWGQSALTLCKNANVLSRGTAEAAGWPKSWDDKMICSNARAFTLPVASFAANAFGLHDMIGNAWEWTQDCFHPTFAGAPTDGSAWVEADCKNRVVRGGGYQSESWIARSASRGGPFATFTEDALGLRLARDLD